MKTCIRCAAAAVVTTMLMFASFPANAASPAEALEKGIYNEETTGNLDEAIKLYRQVLSDAQKTEGLAAQAQYRLGRCLDKLGKKAEAAEAFKTLIRKYPDQKELVAKTKKMLPGRLELLPAPWKSGERTAIPGRRKYSVNIGLRRLGLRKHRRLPTAGDLMSQNR
jgi:tetratricopeptide (TPR) repeat protein